MGKRLPKRATEIAIQFKEVPHRLFKDSATDPEANLLAMRIQPDEGIMLRFGAKVPGLGIDVRNVTMDFTYGSAFQTDSPDAYETLILDALLGDASLFTRADEVEEAWSIVDPIIDSLGDDAGARLPELRGRHLGPGGRRRHAGPRGPPVAPDLNGDGPNGGGPEDAPKRSFGEVIAVGTRPAGGGQIALAEPPRPGEPTLRWVSRAQTIEGIERELARIWAQPNLAIESDDGVQARAPHRRPHVGAEPGRRRPPAGGRRAQRRNDQPAHRPPPVADAGRPGRRSGRAAVDRRPDPGPLRPAARGRAGDLHGADLPDGRRRDGPAPVRARGAAAHPRSAGHGLVARRAARSGRQPVRELLGSTDRLVVDGSAWSGDGVDRLVQLAGLYADFERLSIRDFALVRQSRWREAIATVFDQHDFFPFLHYVRRIAVTYATHDETGAPGTTNIVKPLYHVAWLASRLGMRVVSPLTPDDTKGRATSSGARGPRPGEKAPLHRGLQGRLRDQTGEVSVVVRPVASPMPPGTTLRVEILAERRGSELRTDVTAEAENVHVHAWLDGVQEMDRTFKAPRRTDVDLLGEALETGGRDPLTADTIRMAAAIMGGGR